MKMMIMTIKPKNNFKNIVASSFKQNKKKLIKLGINCKNWFLVSNENFQKKTIYFKLNLVGY